MEMTPSIFNSSLDPTVADYFENRCGFLFYFVAEFFSNLGHGNVIGLILGSLLLTFIFTHRWMPLLSVLLTVPGMLLSELIKCLMPRERPNEMLETGGSFPSGHAVTAVLAFGILLYYLLPLLKTQRARTMAMVFTAVLVVLISLSRIVLDAHYLTDVVAGLVLGVLWLSICILVPQWISRWMHRDPARKLMEAPA